MGIGMSRASLETALFIHALAAPLIFILVSIVYFTKFNFTTPLQTAIVFVLAVIAMDFFVVALMINKSMDMFSSLLGTWIPFGSIFIATYLTGLCIKRKS